MEQLERLENFSENFKQDIQLAIIKTSNVTNIQSWLKRFDQLTKGLPKGKVNYRQIEDHIFELKIICFLIDTQPNIKITYEPVGINKNGKNCDLLAKTESHNYLIEIKCIHPEDRESQIPFQHITQNNTIIMDGVCYHQYQATRKHLIDMSLHTEEKIKNYGDDFKTIFATHEGFYLNIEDFRDFITIYKFNKHRIDDPLGRMTIHNMTKPFENLINEFWAFPFYQDGFDLKPNCYPRSIFPLQSEDKRIEKL